MIYVNLDLSPLISAGVNLGPALKQALKEHGEMLVAQTRAHIAERAAERLHTRRALYIEALNHFQVDDNTWVVNLDARAVWIEDGMGPHSMLDDLLKGKNVKRAKDGSAYVVVPFEHKGGPTELTPAQQTLNDTLRAVMKKKRIPYGKIEKDSSGKPKLGLLHKFDITDAPLKTLGPWGGSSLGHGAVGEVQQGPTGIPFLKGVRVYQKEATDKAGNKFVKRSIMTFRVASSKHRSQGRWEHPGVDAVKFFDEAAKWAVEQWDKEIVPAVIEAVSSQI